MAQQLYDRTAEDLGNLVGLEHVNLRINNQGLASEFYLSALGLTRDPYMFPGTNNMWVNVGNSQFHLPTGDPNVLRGHVGLVVPSLEELCERLGEAKKKLSDTKFDCKQHNAGRSSIHRPASRRMARAAPLMSERGPGRS